VKDRAVEKPGKREQHPDHFYEDEQDGELQYEVDYLLHEMGHVIVH
jgi:hypothetical protein